MKFHSLQKLNDIWHKFTQLICHLSINLQSWVHPSERSSMTWNQTYPTLMVGGCFSTPTRWCGSSKKMVCLSFSGLICTWLYVLTINKHSITIVFAYFRLHNPTIWGDSKSTVENDHLQHGCHLRWHGDQSAAGLFDVYFRASCLHKSHQAIFIVWNINLPKFYVLASFVIMLSVSMLLI